MTRATPWLLASFVSAGAVAAFAACSTQAPAAPSAEPDAAAPDDAGVESPPLCFACVDASYPDIDASLGKKAQLQLDGCAGTEGCHGSSPGIGLTFLPGQELDQLRGVPSYERPEMLRVAPGDPLDSYLYLKVRGDGGIDGSRMPRGAAWDPRIPELFFAWIEAGAPDAE